MRQELIYCYQSFSGSYLISKAPLEVQEGIQLIADAGKDLINNDGIRCKVKNLLPGEVEEVSSYSEVDEILEDAP